MDGNYTAAVEYVSHEEAIMESTLRVNDDDLGWDGDCRTLDGALFTGVGVSYYPDGTLAEETPYSNGFAEGVCKEWYASGQLKEQWLAQRGCAKGEVTRWHPNGVVKSVSEYDGGFEIRYLEWNEAGHLVASRRIEDRPRDLKYFRLMQASRS